MQGRTPVILNSISLLTSCISALTASFASLRATKTSFLSVTFDKEHGYGGYYGELDEGGTLTDDFARMIKALDGFSQDIIVTDMKGVDEYRREYQEAVPDSESIEMRRLELMKRLEEVNREIEKIKAKYE